MRPFVALLMGSISAAALSAPNPVALQTKLDAAWQARTRAMLKELIEIPTVAGRGQMPAAAAAIGRQLLDGGFPAADMRVLPYEGLPGDKTAAFLLRWRAPRPTGKPMLIIGHMDVVEARREDWKDDPFIFREQDGYFYGRGTADMKGSLVAATMAVIKLRKSGFTPRRDIILFFTGDEETKQNGALKGATEWRPLLDPEFALNADGGGGAFDSNGRPLGFTLISAEKTFQTYHLTVRNPGGHSSRPRADNAIYELADALKTVQSHRFTPELNPVTRAYFSERQKDEAGPLGDAMRRWLSNEQNGEAADIIEADHLELGMTRTRCVATMLQAGHADNALPQSATATVNCRIMPGTQPSSVQAELQQAVGPKVEVRPDPNFIGQPTPVFPLRDDVRRAFTNAVRKLQGPTSRVMPQMVAGTSDSSFFRAAGIPTYHVGGGWVVWPEDDRGHGLDERIPVRAVFDDVLHWEAVIRELSD